VLLFVELHEARGMLQPCQDTARPLYMRARSCLGLERIKDAAQVQMSGGKKVGDREDAARDPEQQQDRDRDREEDLSRMRKILGTMKTNPFAHLDGKHELYAQILRGSKRHVALLRTSKTMRVAVQQAEKHEKVHYVVDTTKFNSSTNPSKLGDLVEDLRATCQRYNVVEIKMCGLKYIPHVGSLGDDLNQIAPILGTCAGLTSLSLCDNGLRDTEALGHGLAHCTGLTRLDLSRNRIVWREGALAGCTALRDLNLYENHLNEASTVALGNDLAFCTALTELHLGRTNIDSVAGMTSLVNGLKRCTGLTRLNLSENNMDSVTILADALPALPALVHLNLRRNNMGFAGFCELGRVLSACISLESLDVSQNRISPAMQGEDVDSFMPSLPRCRHLKHLDLSVNSLGANVIGALASVLPGCAALEYLGLSDCELKNTLAVLLVPALPHCLALRELDLGNNGIKKETRVILQKAWAEVRGRDARLLLLHDAHLGY
jgi:Leucine-rich repeat (LRR) protein